MLYIVWSPTSGPLAAYELPELAYAHARTMVGVEVTACERRADLPTIVRDDLLTEFEGDDDTPVTEVAIDDLEDR